MQPHAFVNRLKNIIGRSLPRGLDKIIVESGFDSELALTTIDHSSIKSIEDYVNDNRVILVDTVYEHSIENNLDFKLKPGHKAIILGLPKALQNYELKNKKKRATKNVDEENLKQFLLKKITNFATKCSFDLQFDLNLISEFCQVNEAHKCRFKCPVCPTKIRCEYKKYWLISNLEKHIKNHYRNVELIEIESVESDPIVEAPSSNIESNSAQIISYVDTRDQMNALDNILGD